MNTMTAQEQIQKCRSKRYLELIGGLSADIQKLKPRVDAIFEEGRQCGLTDSEIGKDVRFRMKPYYSRQTIWEVLPSTAKAKPRGRRISKKSLQNDEPSAYGRWNITPEEYQLEYLHQYDNDFLIGIVKMLHKQKDELMATYSKWDTQVEKLSRENKQLKQRIAELEAAKKHDG
jgi:hypothetical protein